MSHIIKLKNTVLYYKMACSLTELKFVTAYCTKGYVYCMDDRTNSIYRFGRDTRFKQEVYTLYRRGHLNKIFFNHIYSKPQDLRASILDVVFNLKPKKTSYLITEYNFMVKNGVITSVRLATHNPTTHEAFINFKGKKYAHNVYNEYQELTAQLMSVNGELNVTSNYGYYVFKTQQPTSIKWEFPFDDNSVNWAKILSIDFPMCLSLFIYGDTLKSILQKFTLYYNKDVKALFATKQS